MANNLESEFDKCMFDLYDRTLKECDYNARIFHRMLVDYRGVETVRKLLNTEEYQEGFTKLWEKNRLDLTVEAFVIEQPWCTLFTKEEVTIARKRLKDHGYNKA